MTADKEQILISSVLGGNTQAFAELVNTYKDMAVLLAYNILLNHEDADEVALDAFVKAYTALRTFKAGARFATWLYRIVVNTALNKKKLKKHYAIELTAALGEQLPADGNAVRAMQITGEHRKHIQAALQTLSLNERLCITLHYLQELSVEEVRSLTGISTANVKVLLHRGRKNLYAALHKTLKGELTDLIKQ